MPEKSKRNRLRDLAAETLRRAGRPLHNSEIANAILPQLALEKPMSAKDVNTALHDDPRDRFSRVGRGTWTLRTHGRTN